jgi:polar amino acid transport system substrate-binding protein
MTSIRSIAAAIALLASAGVASADQLADIKARGTLICGVYGNEEPFGFEDLKTRELVGYEVDICRKVAEGLKVKVEFKVTPAPSKVAELVQNRFDVLAAGLSYTEQRGRADRLQQQHHGRLASLPRPAGFAAQKSR